MIKRDNWGHSYFVVRGEILGFTKDELLRKQPLLLITSTRGKYFDNLMECQDSMFSSHGHVSSIMMMRFILLENTIR